MSVRACLLVGGGPGGTAMLLAAARTGRLGALCAAGLTIVERGTTLGAGRLGGYAITSDSTAETFLTSIKDSPVPALAALVETPEAKAIARHIGALGVPLPIVGAFLDRLGDTLARLVSAAGGQVLFGHELLSARRAGGVWHCRVRRLADGAESELRSRTIVGATGGYQPLDRLAQARVAGEPLVARCGGKLIQSDALLALDGIATAHRRLAGIAAPRIAVIGGSTSAITSAIRLLNAAPSLRLEEGALAVLHRRPLRPFFPSADAARAAGFADFGPDDICPVSGFVYRLAGFRLEARDLVCRMLGIEGRAADPRLRLHRIADGRDEEALAILDRADFVVPALGYRPYGLALLDSAGKPFGLPADGAMVDPRCRMRSAAGQPIPDAFALGLAAGFRLSGALGGEPSFRGQANGLWLWQNDVGAMIAEQVLDRAGAEAVSRAVA